MKFAEEQRKIDDAELKSILQSERSASLGSLSSSDLSDQRMMALDYYHGDMTKTMPAEEGLSSAVSTDVQDVVEGALPIILDVFGSGDKVVQFDPVGPEDVEAAEQETAYINHIFFQRNKGFLTLYTAIKDGLLQKNGFVKWWMESSEYRTRESYKALTEDAYALLVADKELTIIDTEQYESEDVPGVKLYNAIAENTTKKKKPCIGAVPPEELLFSKATRTDIQDSPYWAHVIANRSQAYWIGEFPKKEDVIRNAPTASASLENGEATNRQTVEDRQDGADNASMNRDMRLIEVTEHYIKLALEKDGIVRRYKITTTGAASEILDIEEMSIWPIASGTPIINTHRLIGKALADLVIDIQDIRTSLWRATLNNAYYANNARTEVSESHANENTIDDLLNNRIGGIVRTKIPGGLKQLDTQMIGHWTLPLIENMQATRDARTGVSRTNQGLDPDSLNNSRTGAVSRIMDAAEMRMKLMARVFAETLVADMMRGLHQMIQEYGEAEDIFQLRNEWVTINPRQWKTRQDMTVTLPPSGGSKQMMVQFFGNLLNTQREIVAFQGGEGSLVTFQNVYNTLDEMIKLVGLKGTQRFFTAPPPYDPTTPKPPSPEMVKAQSDAQIKREEIQSSAQIEQMKAMFKQEQDQRNAQHKAQLDSMKAQNDAMLSQAKAENEMRIKTFEAQINARINERQAELQAKPGVGNV